MTLTGGLDWDEDLPYGDPNNTCGLMEASFDWVQFAIDRKLARMPGTVFQSSGGESQLLAHIFYAPKGGLRRLRFRRPDADHFTRA